MSVSETNSRYLIVAAWGAMILGMGILLTELATGILNRTLWWPFMWLAYLFMLLTSVWGMKTLLELQGQSEWERNDHLPLRKKSRKNSPAKNLWKLPIEGQMYLLMAIIMLLGALFGKTNTLMLIFALMAGPFIVNGGVSFAMTRRLQIQRHLPERIMAGETVSIDICLENRKRILSCCLVTVEDRIIGPREMLNGKLIFAQVPARQSRTGRYQARFVQRGRYRLGPTRIVSRFPLGIVERGRQMETYDDLLVYPRIGHIAAWWKRRISDGQESSRTAQGRSGAHQDEFHRIREYRPGDELRSIHWKTTARRNELMVREYRQNRDRRLLLILDLWTKDAKPGQDIFNREVVENAASLAATIGWGHIQECGPQQLDFVCFGAERTEWIRGSRTDQMHGWLDQLALAEPGMKFSPADIQEEILQRQSGTTRCVLLTTRKEKDYRLVTSTGGSESMMSQNVMIVEATPEKTAEFFQLETTS